MESLDMAGSYLPLGDEDLYQDNRPPTPPLTAAPPPPCRANAPCAPVSSPAPPSAPASLPASPMSTILRLKVAELAAVSRIDKTLDKKQKNWTGWAESMYLLFGCANAKGYVEGHIQCPDLDINPDGAGNWEFNDFYTRMLINKNIAASERVHTCGCPTAHKMWTNLRTIHESTCYLVHTDRIRVLC